MSALVDSMTGAFVEVDWSLGAILWLTGLLLFLVLTMLSFAATLYALEWLHRFSWRRLHKTTS